MGMSQGWELHRHGFDQTIHRFPDINGAKIIGRRDVDIMCRSTAVSRTHCKIEYRDGRFCIKDLWSLNGTFVNGVKIHPEALHELQDGDVIGLGIANEREGEQEEGEYFLYTFRYQPVWQEMASLQL